MRITTLLATPATDAGLRRRYGAMGAAAYKAGAKREHRFDPNSMIGAVWCDGYDGAEWFSRVKLDNFPVAVADQAGP